MGAPTDICCGMCLCPTAARLTAALTSEEVAQFSFGAPATVKTTMHMLFRTAKGFGAWRQVEHRSRSCRKTAPHMSKDGPARKASQVACSSLRSWQLELMVWRSGGIHRQRKLPCSCELQFFDLADSPRVLFEARLMDYVLCQRVCGLIPRADTSDLTISFARD